MHGVGYPTPNARSSVSFRVFVPEGVACFCAKCGEKSKKFGCNGINPTPHACILHPILHPKMSVNTGLLVLWCRKCRRFTKTFFVEGGEMRWSGKCKTSDFFDRNYGGFALKVRRFASKKSDVFDFRKGGWRWQCHVHVCVSSGILSRSIYLDAMPYERTLPIGPGVWADGECGSGKWVVLTFWGCA